MDESSSTNDPARANDWTGNKLVSCLVLGTTGFSSYLGLPIFLGVLGEARHMGERAMGWVGSVELLGLLIGSLLTARLVGRMPTRVLAAVGICAAIAGQIGTIIASGIVPVLLLRLLVGTGGGVCYALALACLAGSPRPIRNFSLFGIAMVSLGSIELVALPFLAGLGGLPLVILFLVANHAVAAAFLAWLPHAGPDPDFEPQGTRSDAMYRLGWVSLGGTFVYSIGSTSFWAYVERMGAASGLSSMFVGIALNVGNLACIGTCLLACRLERRWGAAGLQLTTLGTTALIFVTWRLNAGEADFAIRSFAYFQLLVISQILQQSVLAQTDPSGRQAALLPAAQGAGFALGPLFGGTILGAGGGYPIKLMAEAFLLLVSLVIFLAVYRRVSVIERQSASSLCDSGNGAPMGT